MTNVPTLYRREQVPGDQAPWSRCPCIQVSALQHAQHRLDTHTACILLPSPQGPGPLLWGPSSDPTGQTLSLTLIPTAPAPPPPSAAHPTNQLSSLLTFRPILKLSASSKAPLGV